MKSGHSNPRIQSYLMDSNSWPHFTKLNFFYCIGLIFLFYNLLRIRTNEKRKYTNFNNNDEHKKCELIILWLFNSWILIKIIYLLKIWTEYDPLHTIEIQLSHCQLNLLTFLTYVFFFTESPVSLFLHEVGNDKFITADGISSTMDIKVLFWYHVRGSVCGVLEIQ